MSDKIISTKCPVLNDIPFNRHSLEVLVLFLGDNPSSVICPKYGSEGCGAKKGQQPCIYQEDWKSLK